MPSCPSTFSLFCSVRREVLSLSRSLGRRETNCIFFILSVALWSSFCAVSIAMVWDSWDELMV